jgi:hypothetical protein
LVYRNPTIVSIIYVNGGAFAILRMFDLVVAKLTEHTNDGAAAILNRVPAG